MGTTAVDPTREQLFRAAVKSVADNVTRVDGWWLTSDDELAAIVGAKLHERITASPQACLDIATNYLVPALRAERRDALVLERQAEKLAADIAADRAANPVKVRPHWYRVVRFPVTMRRFERVLYAQGEGWFSRWVSAFNFARLSLRRKSA